MRIPALPQPKEIDNKQKGSIWKFIRSFINKRIIKKRSFLRIPTKK